MQRDNSVTVRRPNEQVPSVLLHQRPHSLGHSKTSPSAQHIHAGVQTVVQYGVGVRTPVVNWAMDQMQQRHLWYVSRTHVRHSENNSVLTTGAIFSSASAHDETTSVLCVQRNGRVPSQQGNSSIFATITTCSTELPTLYSLRTPSGSLQAGRAIFVFCSYHLPVENIDYKQLSIT